MTLHYNKFLLLTCVLFSCCTLGSCKKDKDLQSLQSGSYINEQTDVDGLLRMFTTFGEVRDQNLINKYKSQYAIYLLPSGSGTTDTFKITDAQHAQYQSWNLAVTRLDDYYQFRSNDTVGALFQQVDQVMPNIVKYKPYYNVRPAPGGNYVISTLQDFFAAPSGNGLVFPMMVVVRFASIRGQGGAYSSHFNYNKINNVFNPLFPLNVLGTDTMLVLSYNSYYDKLNP